MVENNLETNRKKEMEFHYFYHINGMCQRDCPFCENFDGSLRQIDDGSLEDYLAGNY